MLELMKGISVWQPWAHLLAIGRKKYETRSWTRSNRGWVAIQAARGWNEEVSELCTREPFRTLLWDSGIRTPALDLTFGAVIAVGEIVACHATETMFNVPPEEDTVGDFSFGRFAFEFRNVHRLPEPIKCHGWFQFFSLPPSVSESVLEFIEEVSDGSQEEG